VVRGPGNAGLSADWRAATEDEKNFIDDRKVALFVTEEHEIVLKPAF
jgi:hypothetical protein